MSDRENNEIEYDEYENEHGVVAMFYDPHNEQAWIRSSVTVTVRR